MKRKINGQVRRKDTESSKITQPGWHLKVQRLSKIFDFFNVGRKADPEIEKQ